MLQRRGDLDCPDPLRGAIKLTAKSWRSTMPTPTRAEYRKAMWLFRRRGDELSDLERIVVALCIVSYLKSDGPWTEHHAKELECAFENLFGA
jgi:hypothetical protein